jgi:FkbM family methyltransferase
MKYYSQYGEEMILEKIFQNKQNGLCVEVGAADGLRYSNSRFLIESLNWRAILVEPHPDFFESLYSLYKDNDRVKIINAAVSETEGYADLFLYGRDIHAQVSTISAKQKERVIHYHGDKFLTEPQKVKTITLSSIIDGLDVDFLSIDCEGVDMQVLQSNDWYKNRPYLFCIEHSMEEKELLDYTDSINYVQIYKNIGNTFFVDKRAIA